MSDLLVSIIVPIYNVETYLSQCLDSLVNQTYRNIEIICVNDGSTDNSLFILEKYALEDERIKIVSQKNSGLSSARNIGINYVNGQYICFLDSDDWMEVNAIETVVTKIINIDFDVVLWGYIKEFKNHREQVFLSSVEEQYCNTMSHSLYQRIIGPIKQQLSQPDKVDSFITVWGKLYKASLIKENKITFVSTREIGTEDLLFNAEVFSYVTNALVLDKCYNHYRKYNTTSLTSIYKPELFIRWKSLQDRLWNIVSGDQILLEAYKNRIAITIIGLGLNECFSNNSIFVKYKNLMKILHTDRYKEAYEQLDFSYFPIHWKIFFLCAKYRFGWGLLLLLFCIKRIISR